VKVVVAALAALVLAGPAAAACSLSSLEGQIVCPVCKPETLAQSDAPVAQRMKSYIARRCAAGASENQVKQELVSNFGADVLAAPPKKGFDLLAWWLPIAGVVVAAVVLGAFAWRWSRAREPAPVPAGGPKLDPELERRVDEELARFDR
jgi:cytochrome c-type biogenesis protein CcmH